MIRKQKNQKGFIALISAIVMSAILLLITTSLSLSSFFTRFTILESEYKERSSALAEACVDSALVKILLDNTYSPSNEMISVGENSCLIKKITTNSEQKTILAQGNYQESFTNLSVTVKNSNLEVISWIEISNE